jgi:hypothetical protein
MADDRASAKLQLRTAPRSAGGYRPRSDCRTVLEYWLRYAISEPCDFTYCAPRRIACSLLGWHNTTCVGRSAPHPRSW